MVTDCCIISVAKFVRKLKLVCSSIVNHFRLLWFFLRDGIVDWNKLSITIFLARTDNQCWLVSKWKNWRLTHKFNGSVKRILESTNNWLHAIKAILHCRSDSIASFEYFSIKQLPAASKWLTEIPKAEYIIDWGNMHLKVAFDSQFGWTK